MQRELGTYRSQLKTAKKRARELELNESQIPSLRAEFDREQSSLVGEASALRRQLEETQDQLRREAEMRMKADLATGRARQGELCVFGGGGGGTRKTKVSIVSHDKVGCETHVCSSSGRAGGSHYQGLSEPL